MDKFLTEMAEILEEDTVSPSDILVDFESWDSLAALSVAAMADTEFRVVMSSSDIHEATTIKDLYDRILAKSGS